MFSIRSFATQLLVPFLLIATPLCAQVQEPQSAAVAGEVVGNCQVRNSESAAWMPLQQGRPLIPGTEVKCSAGGRVTLAFRESGALKVVPGPSGTTPYKVPAVPQQPPEPSKYKGGKTAQSPRDGAPVMLHTSSSELEGTDLSAAVRTNVAACAANTLREEMACASDASAGCQPRSVARSALGCQASRLVGSVVTTAVPVAPRASEGSSR